MKKEEISRISLSPLSLRLYSLPISHSKGLCDLTTENLLSFLLVVARIFPAMSG